MFDVKKKKIFLIHCFAINDDKNTYSSAELCCKEKKNQNEYSTGKEFSLQLFLGIFLCQTNGTIYSN